MSWTPPTAFFHAGFEHPADVRVVSPFLAVINPMIDLQEIDMAVIELIKVASRIGAGCPTIRYMN